jgi:hypothetical protein
MLVIVLDGTYNLMTLGGPLGHVAQKSEKLKKTNKKKQVCYNNIFIFV